MSVENFVRNDVLFGEEDWLFLWQGGHQQFMYLCGEMAPSDVSINAFIDNIKRRYATCSEKHLPYLHIVFPSKPTIMTEYIPESIRGNVKSLFERHYSEAIDASGISCAFYPRDLLLRSKKHYQVFSQHDTHMTGIGNAIVSEAIIKNLGFDCDLLPQLDVEDLPRKGDLAVMAGIEKVRLEPTMYSKTLTSQEFDNRSALPSNTGNIVVVHNSYAQSDKRLLALGDSFLRDTISFMSLFFKDIIYIRSDVFQPEMLDTFAPDAVITANTERYLARVRLDGEANSIVMHGYGRPNYAPAPSFSDALCAELSWKYYPSVYRKWAAGLQALTFKGLGTARLNPQVRLGKGHYTFEALDRDPQLLFPGSSMKAGKNYNLRVVMESSVATKAQLYLGRAQPSERPFTEQASVSHPIAVGRNEIVFHISAQGRSAQLRFDPLAASGQFSIESMTLTEAPAV